MAKKEMSTIAVKMGKNSCNLEWVCNPWPNLYLVEKFIRIGSWGPWKKYLKMTPYEELPLYKGEEFGKNQICILTQDVPEKPVSYGGNLYDYDIFCGLFYSDNPRDPITYKKIDLKNLTRVVRNAVNEGSSLP